MASPENQARVSHWVDLHQLNCCNPGCQFCRDHSAEVDSEAMWQELLYFEAADTSLPPMPKKGDRVYIRCGGAVLRGSVVHLYKDLDQFVVNSQLGHHVCTQFDLASAEEACDS